MAFSSGTFTFTSNSFAPSPVLNTVISETAAASTWSELATALSTCLLKDGTQTATASVPFASGIGVGAANAFAMNASGIVTTLLDISNSAAGQVKFPATQNASSNANTLDDYSETSFTATLTGCTTAPTYTVYATKIGNVVTMNIPSFSATSNTTAKTFTGMPAALRPTNTQQFYVGTSDNGAAAIVSLASIASSGVITFYTTPGGAAWTNSGTAAGSSVSISYQAN